MRDGKDREECRLVGVVEGNVALPNLYGEKRTGGWFLKKAKA